MEHAADCADCGKLVADYQAIDASYKSMSLEFLVDRKPPVDRQVRKSPSRVERVGFAISLAASLLLVAGFATMIGSKDFHQQHASSLSKSANPAVSISHSQNVSLTALNALSVPSRVGLADLQTSTRLREDRRLIEVRTPLGDERSDFFVRNLVFSRPPTTIFELAQTSPEFVGAVRLPSSRWTEISAKLDPLNSYLQYSVEFPGVRMIQCSVEMTIDLFQRSLAKPTESTHNLGWYPDAALYALA